MSLSNMLQPVRRAKVPDNVLNLCKECDKLVVENIVTVAQETIPTLDISKTSITVHNGAYVITLPSVTNADKFSLREMLDLQMYSPARIQDVIVVKVQDNLCLQVHVLEETTRLVVAQMDIIRLSKKTKRSLFLT